MVRKLCPIAVYFRFYSVICRALLNYWKHVMQTSVAATASLWQGIWSQREVVMMLLADLWRYTCCSFTWPLRNNQMRKQSLLLFMIIIIILYFSSFINIQACLCVLSVGCGSILLCGVHYCGNCVFKENGCQGTERLPTYGLSVCCECHIQTDVHLLVNHEAT